MTTRSWPRFLRDLKSLPAARGRRGRVRRRPDRLTLEALEDRTVPTAYHVTTLTDGVAGSLRDAIAQANTNAGPDTIDFQVTGTITLTGGQLSVNDSLTIQGPGVHLLTVSGNNTSRVFLINGASAQIDALTITGGNASGDFGGGILALGPLALNDAVVTNNTASTGGGIAAGFGRFGMNRTTVTSNTASQAAGIYLQDEIAQIRNSTVSGNSAIDTGGVRLSALSSDSSLTMSNTTITGNTASGVQDAAFRMEAPTLGLTASATLTNVTIAGNTLTGAGTGGIWLRPGDGLITVRLDNTIVAGNTAGGAAADLLGTFDTLSSHNLLGQGGNLTNGQNGNLVGVTNPLLAPLGNYGGPTPTRALLPGSPALNAGSNAGPPPPTSAASPASAPPTSAPSSRAASPWPSPAATARARPSTRPLPIRSR